MQQKTSAEIFSADAARLISDEEATSYIADRGVPATSSTLRTMRHNRRGPPYYLIAGRAMYRRDDLDGYIASCRVDPASPDFAPVVSAPPKNAATPFGAQSD
jgi:hypothetical protein